MKFASVLGEPLWRDKRRRSIELARSTAAIAFPPTTYPRARCTHCLVFVDPPNKSLTFKLLVAGGFFAAYARERGMGEWKAQISLRVRQALRSELEEFAARERRKLGNITELILEWAFEQLKTAGSTERLLRYKIRPPVKKVADNHAARHKP
jgi:hypothetical protein